MSDRHVTHLLIGGGIASATCARTLREAGADGSILLVGRELDPPYHRPPVTKGYLAGTETKADGLLVPESWWAENDVEMLTRTNVLALDPDAKTAKLSTKEEVSFDTALVATGAMVRRLQVDGAQLEGIHYLRAPGNADAVRRELDDAQEVVLVGGSYIGCEVAATLTALGKSCTILMMEEEPLERGFGPQAGRAFRRILEEHGVTVRGGADVEAFAGDGAEEGERVREVVLAGGDRIPADLVVCGVGAMPDVMLARKSGLEIGELGGVRCDERLRSTSHPHVYAAGDMCEYRSVVHGRDLRVEHEIHAADQGATVARNMLGEDVPHEVVPYFFSDLSDWASLEYVGPAKDWATEEVDGDLGSTAFAIDYKDAEGRTVAYLSAGGHGDLEAARGRIAARG